MRTGMSWALSALGFGVAVLTSVPADAFPFLFGGYVKTSHDVRATAGLDPATRKLIEGLPDEVRAEYVKAMTATFDKFDRSLDLAFDRVDESFLLYIDRVDALLSRKIRQVQCEAIAGAGGVFEEIKAKVFGGGAGPLETLDTEVDAKLAQLEPKISPQRAVALLLDAAQRAEIVKCTIGPMGYVAEADEVIDSANGRYLIWNRVEEIDCLTVAACLPVYRTQVEAIVAGADPRDLEGSGAAVALAGVAWPEPRGGFFGGDADFASYETAFSTLYRVENALGSARAHREGEAARSLMIAGETALKATLSFSPPPDEGEGVWGRALAAAHAGVEEFEDVCVAQGFDRYDRDCPLLRSSQLRCIEILEAAPDDDPFRAVPALIEQARAWLQESRRLSTQYKSEQDEVDVSLRADTYKANPAEVCRVERLIPTEVLALE